MLVTAGTEPNEVKPELIVMIPSVDCSAPTPAIISSLLCDGVMLPAWTVVVLSAKEDGLNPFSESNGSAPVSDPRHAETTKD
jgi:hypothetical protein